MGIHHTVNRGWLKKQIVAEHVACLTYYTAEDMGEGKFPVRLLQPNTVKKDGVIYIEPKELTTRSGRAYWASVDGKKIRLLTSETYGYTLQVKEE